MAARCGGGSETKLAACACVTQRTIASCHVRLGFSPSLCIRHRFNQPGAYFYEQALRRMRELDLPMHQIEEQYRRMAFNIIARNQDDHVKNIAFLMDKSGCWSLSPAFDMTYSYNPSGHWTSNHQMTLNGKRDDFQREDFVACEKNAAMKRGGGLEVLRQAQVAVLQWTEFAEAAGVPAGTAIKIAATHRTGILY
jgi:serine/threonine-protein kinase HipA